MSAPNTPSLSSEPQGSPADLQAQVSSLRGLVNGILLSLLVLTFSGLYVMWVQVRHLQADVSQLRPQVEQMIKFYNENEKPLITGFVNQLVVFSKTNPDFAAVLAKYKGIIPTATSATNLPAPVKK